MSCVYNEQPVRRALCIALRVNSGLSRRLHQPVPDIHRFQVRAREERERREGAGAAGYIYMLCVCVCVCVCVRARARVCELCITYVCICNVCVRVYLSVYDVRCKMTCLYTYIMGASSCIYTCITECIPLRGHAGQTATHLSLKPIYEPTSTY